MQRRVPSLKQQFISISQVKH